MYSDEPVDEKKDIEVKFDRELQGFLRISNDIMRRKCLINDDSLYEIEEINYDKETLAFLNYYIDKIYKNRKVDIRDHIKNFERFYNINKRDILKTDISDSWIKNNNVYLQFGEGFTQLKKQELKFRIRISDIYNTTFKNKKYSENKMMDNDEDKVDESDFHRSDNFLLKFIRLFYYIIDVPEDNEILEDIVRKLENDLNVPDSKRVAPKYKSKNGERKGPDLVSEFVKRVNGVINKYDFPINLPQNVDTIDTDSLLNFTDSVIQNPQVEKILQTIITAAKGLDHNAIKDTASKFMSEDGVVNTEPLKKITDSLYSGNFNEIKEMATKIGINMNSDNFKEIGDQLKNFDTSTLALPDNII